MEAARDYEVVAAFPDGRRAERAVDDLANRGLKRSSVRLVTPDERTPDRVQVGEMRAEMQEEVTEGFAGPSIGFVTPSQAKGAVWGTLIGAVIGLVLGLAIGVMWGWFFESPISSFGRLAIAVICFVIGGATGGSIVGGALKPRRDAERRPGAMIDERRLAGERGTLVAVRVSDEEEASRVQHILEDSGAQRVDALDSEGAPLPPQSEHPRPADPPGWWSDEGRKHG